MSWKLYTSTCYRKNNLHKNRACDGWSRLNMLCLVSGPDKWKQKPDIPCCGDSDYFWNSLSDTARHRISTARKEKGWGPHLFHQIEPNWPLPYSTVPVPRLREARPAGLVTYWGICIMHEYNAEIPKQGRKRFDSSVKTIHFSYLPIIYLCYQRNLQHFLSLLIYYVADTRHE